MTVRPRIRSVVAAVVLTGAAVLTTAGTADAASPVRISKIYYNSPGADDRSNTSLNAEYVVLRNTTTRSQTVTGWTLRDAAGHVYTFPTTSIAAGATVTVHTGKGTNRTGHRYWQRGSYVWNNDRDTAYLRTRAGTLQSTCSYNSTAVASKTC